MTVSLPFPAIFVYLAREPDATDVSILLYEVDEPDEEEPVMGLEPPPVMPPKMSESPPDSPPSIPETVSSMEPELSAWVCWLPASVPVEAPPPPRHILRTKRRTMRPSPPPPTALTPPPECPPPEEPPLPPGLP